MRLTRVLPLVTALLLIGSAPVFADATVFVGSSNQPTNRPVKGFAIGATILIIGIEFEYANVSEEPDEAAPSLRTGMGNVLVQTPIPVAGTVFYLTAGGGGYRERLGDDYTTHVGVNTGGGAKISLAGPIRARVDYRVFKLRGEPRHPTVHRIYAGLNLAF